MRKEVEELPKLAQLKIIIQSALLNKITDNLRAVCLGDDASVYFNYDHVLSDEDSDLLPQIINEIKSPGIHFHTSIVPYPKKMLFYGHWVFYRYEDSSKYID